MKKLVKDRLNEDGVMISDPDLANKMLLAQREVNNRLKKKAQLDKEIIVYKQKMAEIERQAIKKQVATTKATGQQPTGSTQTAQQQEIAKQQQALNLAQVESIIPTFDEFLKEYNE